MTASETWAVVETQITREKWMTASETWALRETWAVCDTGNA